MVNALIRDNMIAMSNEHIQVKCRRLARELVACLVELECDGAAFPLHSGGRDWWVVVDPADGHTRKEFPTGFTWGAHDDGFEWDPNAKHPAE
jgi:hypothetical protein